jgi:Trypsin-co-occurring domain 1
MLLVRAKTGEVEVWCHCRWLVLHASGSARIAARLSNLWFASRCAKGRDVNGTDENVLSAVTARLPSGVPVRVEVAGLDASDGMTRAGLRESGLSAGLDSVSEIGSLVVDKLKAARPATATAELRPGFAVEAGKLIALRAGGKGEASLTVTLERPGAEAGTGNG